MIDRNRILAIMRCCTFSLLLPSTTRALLQRADTFSSYHRLARVATARRTLVTAHATTPPTPTRYTIDCPPTSPDTLQKTVTKSWQNLDRYTASKPVAGHTQAAFDQLLHNVALENVILDSGCGTGRSSIVLGELHPNSVVIGIDRSVHRLRKNPHVPRGSDESKDVEDDGADNGDSNLLVQQVAANVWLVRAELADFWRCLARNECHVQQHYLLYPNPYPKLSRLKLRWYAHPAFSLLLQTAGEALTVRSNWKHYLEEFAVAATIVADLNKNGDNGHQCLVPGAVLQRSPQDTSWTNFEEKYKIVGEATYELVLNRHISGNEVGNSNNSTESIIATKS